MSTLPNRFRVAAIMVAAVLGGSAVASADSGSEWFRGNNAAIAPPAQGDFGGQNAPPAQTASRSRYNTSGDFPEDAVHDWVVATARWAYTRAAVARAERELDNTVRNVQLNFEQSTEYTQAVKDEKAAHEAFSQERQKALESVIKDPKYSESLKLRDQLGDQLSRVRAEYKNDLPGTVTLTIASQKLRYATDAHNLEVAALEKADKVKAAQARLVEASTKVNELHRAFENSIRNNPQILQARRTLDDARMSLAAADAYLSAAHDAAQVAADYSYFRHRYDGLAAPINSGFGPYGYGY